MAVLLQDDSKVNYFWSKPKIQQIKMLVMCQSFGDLFLFGLVWDCFTNQNQYKKLGSKSWLLTCSSNITLSQPSYTVSTLQRGLNFSNG